MITDVILWEEPSYADTTSGRHTQSDNDALWHLYLRVFSRSQTKCEKYRYSSAVFCLRRGMLPDQSHGIR